MMSIFLNEFRFKGKFGEKNINICHELQIEILNSISTAEQFN